MTAYSMMHITKNSKLIGTSNALGHSSNYTTSYSIQYNAYLVLLTKNCEIIGTSNALGHSSNYATSYAM